MTTLFLQKNSQILYETTLDGDTLRTEAATEKELLVTQLREMLEQTSRRALLEADKDEAQHLQEKLKEFKLLNQELNML